jgi:hypothetical protein
MLTDNRSKELINQFPSLSLAIAKLFERQEKDWGHFQVKKEEDGLYRLYISSFPSLKFYQNPDNHIYKAFWADNKEPSVYIKKKQRKVYDPDTPRLEKKQRIYEVIYQYDSRTEIHLVNKILATFIRDQIEQKVIYIPQEEVMPLVLITEEI